MKNNLQLFNPENIDQFNLFPGTRYMGSKNKIILDIHDILKDYKFQSFLDVFAGSNVVAYFMKTLGKKVITNDFMAMSYYPSKALIENNSETLSDNDINFLLTNPSHSSFISSTFKDLYFSEEENEFLDRVRSNIELFDNEYKKAIALASLIRACMKKRPRGIFTYIGQRYNDGRKDIRKSLNQHFLDNIDAINKAIFYNGQQCQSLNELSQNLVIYADLVYLDPPYYSLKSDNDYVRRYHFVEGLAKNWEGLEIQKNTLTKKFKSYPSPFSRKETAIDAFRKIFSLHQRSILAVSYSSNSLPEKEELKDLLHEQKKNVQVHEISHVYSFGNQNHKKGNSSNRVKEYLFIAH